jgi:hypothetical protein
VSVLAVAATALVLLGLGMLAALVGILFRHAIPRAPVLFHGLLVVPMLLSSFSCFVIAFMALSGVREVFGVDALGVLTVYFVSQVLVWWTLNAYAVYHFYRSARTYNARGAAQDARDVSQGVRDERQDDRSLRQTQRGTKQDERGDRQDEREARQEKRHGPERDSEGEA